MVQFINTVVADTFVIAVPLTMAFVVFTYMWLYERTRHPITKSIFFWFILVSPFISMYPLAVVDSLYSKLMILMGALMLFPVILGLVDIIMQVVGLFKIKK